MTKVFDKALECFEEYDDGLRDCPFCNGIGDFPFANAPESITGKPCPRWAGHSLARPNHSMCWHCQGTGMMHKNRIAKVCLSCGETSDQLPRQVCSACENKAV